MAESSEILSILISLVFSLNSLKRSVVLDVGGHGRVDDDLSRMGFFFVDLDGLFLFFGEKEGVVKATGSLGKF